jgi:hypothetical protein
MTIHLQICCRASGSWSVHGLSPRPATHLPSLSASIDYARRQCGEAPATIELIFDGFYAVAHQENGWPRELLAPEVEPGPPPGEGCRTPGHRALTRLRHWFGRQLNFLTGLPRAARPRPELQLTALSSASRQSRDCRLPKSLSVVYGGPDQFASNLDDAKRI